MHVIDGTSPDPVGDYSAIQTELDLFAEDLATKPQVGRLACRTSLVADTDCPSAAVAVLCWDVLLLCR